MASAIERGRATIPTTMPAMTSARRWLNPYPFRKTRRSAAPIGKPVSDVMPAIRSGFALARVMSSIGKGELGLNAVDLHFVQRGKAHGDRFKERPRQPPRMNDHG